MPSSLADSRDFVSIAAEALSRYKLRTSLSVLGIVLGVAAVIAMMSVSEGARREALDQVEALGLDNLVARNRGFRTPVGQLAGLVARDADLVESLVPLARAASPVIQQYIQFRRGEKRTSATVVGVRASYQMILRLGLERGRFLSATDERTTAAVCVLGGVLAGKLFGYRDPIGDRIRIGDRYYEVVGVLREQGGREPGAGTLAWRDVNDSAIVPLSTLSGRTIDVAPDQVVDEVWLQISDGSRVDEVAGIFERALVQLHDGRHDFDIVVPRELLAQRYRTQRTFAIVVGSVAALALLVGGIGIMNIMLTSVVERTHEIGIRRTVGATRRDVTLQFLVEALMMTVSGGAVGIATGAAVSWAITAYAGWRTRVSPLAVALAFGVSFLVGLIFGSYPARKAAYLEPVDAVRYE
jgi:putative ABC transport system permease protein